MSLRNALRKAAELIVELPPEERETETARPGAASSSASASSTDAMWAELEKAAARGSGSPSASSALSASSVSSAGSVSASRPAAAPYPAATAPTKTVAQIVQEAHGPNLDQIRVAPEKLPADMGAADGSSVDFGAIYAAAHLPPVPYTAEQALEMLNSLPAELPLDTRRQMIKAAINSMGKAIGASPENIVSDASRKLAALAAYTDHQTRLLNEYAAAAEQKIAGLQAQIEQTRQAVANAQGKQSREIQACQTESDRLDDILEFFSLDVPPSKYAPQSPTNAPSNPSA